MHPIINSTKPKLGTLPGFWETDLFPFEEVEPIYARALPGFTPHEVIVYENVFTKSECQKLIDFMNQSPNFEEVGVQGMKDQKDTRIGSLRTSIWSPKIARFIWNRIVEYLPGTIQFNKSTSTDWWQGKYSGLRLESDEITVQGDPIAISPLLRFMKYGNEGQHYAHYDAAFIYPEQQFRSLKSMVIYLTTNENAATRFIRDEQTKKPIWDRNHEDWNRPVLDEEVIAKSECVAGNVLFFDHRICHDVQQYFGDTERVIIRGDLIYELFYSK